MGATLGARTGRLALGGSIHGEEKMKTMMKTVTVVVATALASMIAACSADEVGDEPEADPAVASTQQAVMSSSGGTGTKTIGDLKADGYTCSEPIGTLTLCWKNGSPGYSCNEKGVCIQNARRAPGRIIVAPMPTAVLLSP
jgi:hypothetical protein